MKAVGKLMIAAALSALMPASNAHDFNAAECADLARVVGDIVADRDSGVAQSQIQIAHLIRQMLWASLSREDGRKTFDDDVDKKRYAELRDYIYRHPQLEQWQISQHVNTACMYEFRGAVVK